MKSFTDVWVEDDKFYMIEMSNIIGRYTKLPMTLFFSGQPSNHKIRPIRFKVSENPQKFIDDNSVIDYKIIDGDDGISIVSVDNKELKSKHKKLLHQYISTHYESIKQYWEYTIDSVSFTDEMRKTK